MEVGGAFTGIAGAVVVDVAAAACNEEEALLLLVFGAADIDAIDDPCDGCNGMRCDAMRCDAIPAVAVAGTVIWHGNKTITLTRRFETPGLKLVLKLREFLRRIQEPDQQDINDAREGRGTRELIGYRDV